MSFRFLRSSGLYLAAAIALAALPACSFLPGSHKKEASNAAPEVKPGVAGRRGIVKGLTIELKSSPDPVKLGEVRQIDVTMLVYNNTKKSVGLKFATTQLIEILLREADSGKVVAQWSTDQTFLAMGRYLIINPKERLEYVKPIATRDLKPGKSYTLEAYFVGYDQDLRATRPIVPQP